MRDLSCVCRLLAAINRVRRPRACKVRMARPGCRNHAFAFIRNFQGAGTVRAGQVNWSVRLTPSRRVREGSSVDSLSSLFPNLSDLKWLEIYSYVLFPMFDVMSGLGGWVEGTVLFIHYCRSKCQVRRKSMNSSNESVEYLRLKHTLVLSSRINEG